MTLTECRKLFCGKQCTVLGIGVSNRPLVDFLLECGAVVTARDKKEPSALGESADAFSAAGVRLITGADYLANIRADYLFRSPGIRPDKKEILDAVANGAVLLSEMELFCALCPCPIFGITGSDGKTTTTTLVALLLEAAGKRVFLGGNIGTPLLPLVKEMTPDDYAVVELSSFQLMTIGNGPARAAITNLSPNHLDWHTGMEEYVESKCRIFGGENCRTVVLNAENEGTAAIADRLDAAGGKRVCRFSSARILSGEGDVYEKDGVICRGREAILPTDAILLPGRHNVENYMTAIAMVGDLVPAAAIRSVAKTFPGVEHRIEFVREKDGVRFYNSSIDSTPSRTAAALRCFPERLIVICGGYDKHIPFGPLGEVLCEKAKTVVLTGATRDAIRASIEEASAVTKPQILTEPDFDMAVAAAAKSAESGDIVILSPGCASFDAFPNFAVRGERFKQIVGNL